jgi:transcriptional regulator with XRE-family HTH domain
VAGSTVQVRELLSLNIKTLRKKLGLSQEKLAEAAGLSGQSISDIEGCRTWVSDKTLEKLAQALNTGIFQLFIPSSEYSESAEEALLYNRLMKLGTSMKEDIDNRLDRFYLSEKAFLR